MISSFHNVLKIFTGIEKWRFSELINREEEYLFLFFSDQIGSMIGISISLWYCTASIIG